MGKLLSVILPTSNRGPVLTDSLPLFDEQVSRNKGEIEFVVCDNASSDDTVDRIGALQRKYEWITFIHYTERVEDIGASIARAAGNAHGDYILFWGDDDIPGPFMLDAVITTLQKYPNLGCLIMNRLQSGQRDYFPYVPAYNLRALGRNFPGFYTFYKTAQDFIYANAAEFGFLGAYVFSRNVWANGIKLYDPMCFGYQFQVPLFGGLTGHSCLRINYPMFIQREIGGIRYKNLLALYRYVGLPRVYPKKSSWTLGRRCRGL